jgi:hypothetical protein
MRTNLKKSVTFSRSAGVAAAGVRALLYFGAGTSQANRFDSCNSNRLYTGD